MQPFSTAKLILYIVAGSYLVSAALLGVMRARGTTVPAWEIGAWLATGLIGVALTYALGPGRGGVWWGLLVVLLPWMVYALVGDVRRGYYVIAAVDVAGVAAIAYALAITFRDTMRS